MTTNPHFGRIGASQVAALFGLHPWMDELSVYRAFTDPHYTTKTNDDMELGLYMEGWVEIQVKKEFPELWFSRCQEVFYHPNKLLSCTPDMLSLAGIPCQIKTTRDYPWEKLPDHVAIQVAAEMAVLKASRHLTAVFFFPSKSISYYWTYLEGREEPGTDPALIVKSSWLDAIAARVEEWVEKYPKAGLEPAGNDPEPVEYFAPAKDKTLISTDETWDILEAMQFAKEQEDLCQLCFKALESQIIPLIGEHHGAMKTGIGKYARHGEGFRFTAEKEKKPKKGKSND